MNRILFICYGNICRSPMAEFIFKDIVNKECRNEDFYIASAATSYEEIGNSVHHGTRTKLAEYGISTAGKTAVHLEKSDYNRYDYLIGMESRNINDIMKIIGNDPENKVHKLLDFADGGDIADPWYTHNFDDTYRDVLKGCTALFNRLK